MTPYRQRGIASLSSRVALAFAVVSLLTIVAVPSAGAEGEWTKIATFADYEFLTSSPLVVGDDLVAWSAGYSGVFKAWTPSGGVRTIWEKPSLSAAAFRDDRYAPAMVLIGADWVVCGYYQDLRVWSPSAGLTTLSTACDARGADDRCVAWTEDNAFYRWTPQGGKQLIYQRPSSGYAFSGLVVTGGAVAWMDKGVWLWDEIVGARKISPTEGVFLQATQGRLVWSTETNTWDDPIGDIVTWSPSDGVRTIASQVKVDEYRLFVGGERVSWVKTSGTYSTDTTGAIWSWSAPAGAVKVADSGTLLAASGGDVYWQAPRADGLRELYRWAAATGSVKLAADADSYGVISVLPGGAFGVAHWSTCSYFTSTGAAVSLGECENPQFSAHRVAGLQDNTIVTKPLPIVSKVASVTLSVPTLLNYYPGTYYVKGAAFGESGGALANRRLYVQVSTNGTDWRDLMVETTDGSAKYSRSVTNRLDFPLYFRTMAYQSGEATIVSSSVVRVRQRLRFGTFDYEDERPDCPDAYHPVKLGKTVTITEQVRPAHAAGTRAKMEIQWRPKWAPKTNTRWSSTTVRSISLTRTSSASLGAYSLMRQRLTLNRRGQWRVRLICPADAEHPEAKSPYLYFLVQ